MLRYGFIPFRRQLEIKGKTRCRGHTLVGNPKKNIPLVSLLLVRKMVAVCCSVWPPALRLWLGRPTRTHAGRQTKIQVSVIFKNILYLATCKRFLVSMLYLMLDGLILYSVKVIFIT